MITKNIADLVPKDAVSIADTPEYSAWMSRGGSEAWIDMKEPDTFVTEGILQSVVKTIYNRGGHASKLTIPDGQLLSAGGTAEGIIYPIDLYATDYGAVGIIDLKRQEAEAKLANFVNVLNGPKLDNRTSRAVSIFTNLKENAVEIIKFMREVMNDESLPIDLRRRAAEFILEDAPEANETAKAKNQAFREFLAEKSLFIAEHFYKVMIDESAPVGDRMQAAMFIAEAAMLKPATEANDDDRFRGKFARSFIDQASIKPAN